MLDAKEAYGFAFLGLLRWLLMDNVLNSVTRRIAYFIISQIKSKYFSLFIYGIIAPSSRCFLNKHTINDDIGERVEARARTNSSFSSSTCE